MADSTGRARGRSRGRATGGPSAGGPPQPQRPQQPPPQQQQPQQQQQQPPDAPLGRALIRPAAPTRVGPPRGATAAPVEAMARLDIGASGAAPTAGRGALRGRREIGTQYLVTRPKNLVTKIGTGGTPIQLTANYFKIEKSTDWCLYQYRVDFSPDVDLLPTRKGLLRVHKEKFGGYLFDGTVMFTSCVLHPDPMEVFSERESDKEKIKITIKKVGDLAVGDMAYIQLYNILMRACLQSLKLQLVGRDYFDVAAKITLQAQQLELWPGYITSIRQHEDSLLMVCEVTHKVMRQTTALELLGECYNRSRDGFKELFLSAIVGTVVLTDYNNHTYRIDDVDFSKNPSSTFSMKNEQVSFKDYFHRKYGLKITDGRQPLLVSRASARDRRAGRTDDIILIPELCRLTGITDEMRANFKVMAAIAEYTRITPSARQQKLNSFIQRVVQNEDVSREMKLWNLKLSSRLLQLDGRILPTEKITHGGNNTSTIDPQTVEWTKNLIKKSFLLDARIMTWAVICHPRGMREVKPFVSTLQRSTQSYNYKIPDPIPVEIPDDRAGSYVSAIEKLVAERNPDLIMCVLPNNRADRYSAIKKKACVDRPVPTQVVLSKNVAKSVMAVASKIGVQINCKLGGAPWGVEIPLKKTMIVGYDATRDTATKGNSFGAMVASLNQPFTQYFSSVMQHKVGEELSDHISVQLFQACLKYQQYNRELPEKIVFYRDGVGDGQLDQVYNHEIAAIKKKLTELYKERPPAMTYVVVSKKINTRFFCGGNNPPPGTVVDSVVTSPQYYDFFLVSQSVRQGTVTPTMYNVIFDTINLPPDRLQRLTYKLCHLYFNWSGTIRVPAPCQYAHKLAFLVGQSIHRLPSPQLEDKLYFL